MFQNRAGALFILILAFIEIVPASAQSPAATTGVMNGPCSTGRFNTCPFLYNVPSQRIPQLLNEVRTCVMASPTQVKCSQPLRGNYGQARNLPAKSLPLSFPIPSTPPPMGVALEKRAEADQMWQRASALLDRNRYGDAMPLLYRGALMGDRRSEATLGIRYQNGEGVKADDHAAAYWYGLAAAQGHRASQYALGGMYFEGDGGLPKDWAKAAELFTKSANQGFGKAQLALGIASEFGEGVPRNRTKAIALIRKSGEAGEIADILANPRTPSRFADEEAFGRYLVSLNNARFAASWSQARASRGACLQCIADNAMKKRIEAAPGNQPKR
jgi:TPR repeat protein